MIKNKEISALSLSLLWFGAACSMAEVLTGGLLAPLGWWGGLAVILAGHIVGGGLFWAVGWLSWKSQRNAIGVVELSFGSRGPAFFGLLNVLQLVGWTAVMVVVGSQSLDAIAQLLWQWSQPLVWKILLGGMLIVWAALGLKGLHHWNAVIVGLLFLLTLVLGWVVFHSPGALSNKVTSGLRFSDAWELVIVMPLSWLPLVGDYTSQSSSRRGPSAAALGYFVASVWMYSVGLASALALGTANPTLQMIQAGLGLVGLAIVAISTATSGFLDVLSSGISFQHWSRRASAKLAAFVLGGIGIGLALILPMDQYQNFLYWIGSVFAPLYAIVLVDYLLFRQPPQVQKRLWAIASFGVWVLGVILYYSLQTGGTPVGITVPTLMGTAALNAVIKTILVRKGVSQ